MKVRRFGASPTDFLIIARIVTKANPQKQTPLELFSTFFAVIERYGSFPRPPNTYAYTPCSKIDDPGIPDD